MKVSEPMENSNDHGVLGMRASDPMENVSDHAVPLDKWAAEL